MTGAFGSLDNYIYYAPLRAVVATYPTVAGAVRTTLESAWSLALGGTLGLVVHQALGPGLFSRALVAGVGGPPSAVRPPPSAVRRRSSQPSRNSLL